MSSLAFMGFFCLAEGKRVMTTRPNSTRIWHAHYTSTVQCADGTFLPANIRVYSPMNDVPHPDNTIAYVYARAHITNDLTVLMDASEIIACPGDPDDDSYQDSVPDMPNPFLIALGHVSGKASHLPDGSRSFPLAASEYVRDNTHLSTIRCAPCSFTFPHFLMSFCSAIFSSSRPRWKNTNVPFPGSIVLIIGHCSRILDGTNLAVDIENIVLNVPTSPVSALSPSEGEQAAAAGKKRKFSAMASSKTPSQK